MSQIYIFGKLYAEPSFVEGMARNLDFLNTLREYNESPNEVEADIHAMKNDWRMVGKDLQNSISTYEQQLSKSA